MIDEWQREIETKNTTGFSLTVDRKKTLAADGFYTIFSP